MRATCAFKNNTAFGGPVVVLSESSLSPEKKKKSHDFVLPLTPRAHVAIKQEPFTIRGYFGIGE